MQLRKVAEYLGLAHGAKDTKTPFAKGVTEYTVSTASSRFDTSFYLATYPDVRAALAGSAPGAAEAHYVNHGRREIFEGRRPISVDFDENVYLSRRPDAMEAVSTGSFLSGYDHWLLYGRSEIADGDGVGPFESHPAARPAVLTEELVRFWHLNGFVILKGLISPERCKGVNQRIDALWADRGLVPPLAIDINLDPKAERVRFDVAPIESRTRPYKLNDLFLIDATVQGLALDETLVSVLHWILNAQPACMASLNFERSSTQGFHQDTLYMPGRRPGGMAAAWFALEDVSPAAGPLAYYPGSHRIPLFHFSWGKPNQIDSEFGTYYDYMMTEVAARGLKPITYLPRKGDVLIWNERLFHAGSQIDDLALTRKSLVTHYWRADELPHGNTKQAAGGLYWDRDLM